MNHFIFASNLDNPTQRENDLVGVYQEVSDENIFYALADVIQLGRLKPGKRIRVETFNHVIKTVGDRRYWEFRMATDLHDKALMFSTIRENVPGLGPCGLIPLGRHLLQAENDVTVAGPFFPLLDVARNEEGFQ